MSESGSDEKQVYENELKLIYKYHKTFFKNINIKYIEFKKNNYNVDQVLDINDNLFYYNDIYMDETDKNHFNDIYNAYYNIVVDNLCEESDYMALFNDFEENGKTTTYDMQLIENYEIFSPTHVLKIFNNYYDKYNHNDTRDELDKIYDMAQKHLTNLKNKVDNICEEYYNTLRIITTNYLHTKNPYGDDMSDIIKYASNIIKETFLVIDKLLAYKVITINSCVSEVMDNYMSLYILYDIDAYNIII